MFTGMGKFDMILRPYRFDLMQGFFSKRVFPWFFARVEISPEHLKKWRGLVSRGVVVPLLDSPSRVDFLALYYLYQNKGGNYPRFPMGISMIPWISIKGWAAHLIGYTSWILKKVCIFDPFSPEDGKEVDRLGRVPFTLYIHPAGSYVQRCLNFRMNPLEAIVRYQRRCSLPIYLVPHLLIYDVLPQTEKRSLYTAFWGRLATPKWTLRTKNILMRKGIQVRLGTPIDVQRILRQYNSQSDIALSREIHRSAAAILDKKMRGISGPPLPSRDRMITQLLEDPDLWKFIEKKSREQGKSSDEIAKRARNYASEIASDLRPSYVKQWEKVLRWVWQSLYDGVDINREAQQRLRRIARNYPIIYIPSHKSHIDYFLLSFILYEMNLPLPLIAAGTNLSFWPVGPIFRRSGAFFIRRTFRNNPLYGEVFYFYLRELIREGIPIEFFIEGGRSRTGKLIFPKKGMISMILRAFFEGAAPDIYFVPTAISYEKIVEEENYIRELRGDEKRKEKMWDLFRIRKIFRKRYGTVYVRFGTPVSLKRYLHKNKIHTLPESIERRRVLYQSAADDIIRDINKAMVVTPSSLVAAALLSYVDRSVGQFEIIETAKLYLRILRDLGADFPFVDEEVLHSISRSIRLFMQDGVLCKGHNFDSDNPQYFVPLDKRIHLEFSKNMMVSHLAPLSLYCWVIQAPSEEVFSSNYQAFNFLFYLFRHEFLMFPDSPMHWYRLGHARLGGVSVREVQKLRQLTTSALEGYFVGASYTLKDGLKVPLKENRFIQEMIRWGKDMVETEQVRCPESVTSAILQGWLRVASEKGIIAVAEEGELRRRRERMIERGPNFQKVREVVGSLNILLSVRP